MGGLICVVVAEIQVVVTEATGVTEEAARIREIVADEALMILVSIQHQPAAIPLVKPALVLVTCFPVLVIG